MAIQARGKLMWGQAGNYNADDDRAVIAATLGGMPGLWRPPELTRGSGLNLSLGRFVAAVPCDDGTVAIAVSTSTITIQETASGPARTDNIWLSSDPDNAQWGVEIVPEGPAMTGRMGVSLGRIIVPANTSTIAGMSFWPGGNNFGWIRNYDNHDERALATRPPQLTVQQRFGALTTIARGGSNSVMGTPLPPHLDIAGNQYWETLYSPYHPGYVEGFATAQQITTNANGDIIVYFPIPFDTLPIVVGCPGLWGVGIVLIHEIGYNYVRARCGLNWGVPVVNAAVQVFFMARGVIRTAPIDMPQPPP